MNGTGTNGERAGSSEGRPRTLTARLAELATWMKSRCVGEVAPGQANGNRIPCDILVIIFSHLRPMAWNTVDTPHHLATVVLVSREWNYWGTPILFKNPILDSPRRLHLFVRTVIDNAQLGSLVQSLTVLNIPFVPSRVLSFAIKMLRYPNPQEDLSVAMLVCPNVAALGIVFNQLNFPSSTAPSLPDLTVLAHLRKLQICAKHTTFPDLSFFPATIEFLVLEELSLECLIVDKALRWPRLPALTHLRLQNVDVFEGSLIPKDLPFLRWVELISVGSQDGTENLVEALYGYADVLEGLAISLRLVTTPTVLEISRLKGLKHLAIDYNAFNVPPRFPIGTSVQPGLMVDRLPPTLITLDVLDLMGVLKELKDFYVDPSWPSTSAVQKVVKDGLVRVFSGGRDSVPCLEALYIEGDGNIWEQSRDELSLSCNVLGVKYETLFHGVDPLPFTDGTGLGEQRLHKLGWPASLEMSTLCEDGSFDGYYSIRLWGLE
ncbi:hypothetical protein JAAARDRAFT_201548 [Jaapia argillacea MUCL 33604]|uniref:F-box domain-containing protein n=1 Tax=Jaapia argillacea MUCL 33604 TaxID=933084 RepID=A0A067QB14_9AGAM|nr:hypothetical protein JAAARDRAFT_201548 [Jaapia argillacea MUCL 33604]